MHQYPTNAPVKFFNGLVSSAALIALIFGLVTPNLRHVFGAILAVLAVNVVRSRQCRGHMSCMGSHRLAYSIFAIGNRCTVTCIIACRSWWHMLFQRTEKSQKSRIEGQSDRVLIDQDKAAALCVREKTAEVGGLCNFASHTLARQGHLTVRTSASIHLTWASS